MAGLTSSTVDDLITAAVFEAQLTITQNAFLKNFVTVAKIPQGAVSMKFPVWGASGATVETTENAEISSFAALATSGGVATAGRNAVAERISDQASHGSAEDLGLSVGKLLGAQLAGKINQDIWALFDGFSKSVGASNTNITLANIASGVTYLRTKGAVGPYTLAVTPFIYEDLLNLYSPTGSAVYRVAPSITEEAQKLGVIDKLQGVDIVMINDLTADTMTAADAKCGLIAKSALGYAEIGPVQIEVIRNPKANAWEVVASIHYGVCEINDLHGVEFLVDNDDTAS